MGETKVQINRPDGRWIVSVSMEADEMAFLEQHLRPEDHVFEWGSGGSSLWLAAKVRRVTTVEHDLVWAQEVLRKAPPNLSLLYVPPDKPWNDDGSDGDGETFQSYANAVRGRSADVVVLDGRACVACAAIVALWMRPEPRVLFLHDCHRGEYATILTVFRETGRVGNLMRLEMR